MVSRDPDPVRASIAPRIRYAGAVVGILATCGVVLLLPFLLHTFGLQVSTAWGLGKLAAPICLVGSIPGLLFARQIFQWGGSFGLIG